MIRNDVKVLYDSLKMETAALRGDLELVKFLYDKGEDLSPDPDNSPLHNAARGGLCGYN